MASEEYIPAPALSQKPQPPLSVTIPDPLSAEGPYCLRRPRLNEILANTSPSPWTLTAFMAYLSSNHCLETLEFIMDAARYRKHYNKMLSRAAGSDLPPLKDREYVQGLWDRLIEAYIAPNGSRAVNLPYEVRNPVMHLEKDVLPPAPGTLDGAISKTYELMEESVLGPFLNSFCPQSAHPGTLSIQHRATDETLGDDDNVSVATSSMSFDPNHRTLFGSRRSRQSVRNHPTAGLHSSAAAHRPSCPADHTISPPLSPRSSQHTHHPLHLRKSATTQNGRQQSPNGTRTSLSHTLSSPAALLRRDPNGTSRASRPTSTVVPHAPISIQNSRTDSLASDPTNHGGHGDSSANTSRPNVATPPITPPLPANSASAAMPPTSTSSPSPPLLAPHSQGSSNSNNVKRDSFFHFGAKPDQDSSQHLPPNPSPQIDESEHSREISLSKPLAVRHRHQSSQTSISMPAAPIVASSGNSSGGGGGVWQKLGNRLAGRIKSTRSRSAARNVSSSASIAEGH